VVTFNVTGNADCDWSPKAAADASWVTNLSPTSGQGPGQVSFRVAANTGPQRATTIAIVDQTFSVTQTTGCTFTLNKTSQTIGSAGGSIAVTVTSDVGCTWTAGTIAPWLSISQGASGSGTGNVTIGVQSNTGPQRSATVTIAGRTFTVTQDAGCLFVINPLSRTFNLNGGSDQVAVTAPSGCAWTAQVAADSVAWIAITSGDSGSGNGTVKYMVSRLFLGSRTGTITIAGQTFTVKQQ